MLKALEQFLHECEPASFKHTKAMDDYAFAIEHGTYSKFSPDIYRRKVSRQHAPTEITNTLQDLLQQRRYYSLEAENRPSMLRLVKMVCC